jgi:hypothetical protein
MLSVVLAVLFGLLISWLCLYVLGRIGFPSVNHRAVGCTELDHCPRHWWTLPVLFAGLLGPALIFGCLGYRAAAKGWSVVKWAVVLCLLVLGTAAYYSSPYLMR